MIPKIRIHIITIILTLVVVLGAGTIAYRYLEEWSWVDALYFSTMTVTTVGYGDHVPTTDISKMFTIIYSLIGISIALASFGIIGTAYLQTNDKNLFGKNHKDHK